MMTTDSQGSQRDQLRAQIFNKNAFKTEPLKINGAKVDLRQPPLGMVLGWRESNDAKGILATVLVQLCFVPGTDIRVFDEEDVPSIMELPADKWFVELNNKLMKLTDIDIKELEKNLEKTRTA